MSVQRLLATTQATPHRLDVRFRIQQNKVQPSALINACLIYENGDAVLEMKGMPSRGQDDVVVSFDGLGLNQCDLSKITMILLSPSCGDWTVPALFVEDGEGNTREFVATNTDESCVFVLPKPPSPERIKEGMLDYSDMKQEIVKRHISFVGAFTLMLHFVDPTDVHAKWFALGGGVGLMYQLLIQMEIDQIGNENKGAMYRLLANPLVRLSLFSSAFVLATVDTAAMGTTTYAAILAGFMMNKLAMYATIWTKK